MLKEGHLRVSIDRVEPNPWNPNEMDKQSYEKLKINIKKTLDEAQKLPPIIVRPNKPVGNYQIIDGYHRWKICTELGLDKINVFSLQVNDKAARILTTNLNYLRGKANRAKYAKGLVDLIEMGTSVEELERLLPETQQALEQLLAETDITVKAYEQLSSDEEAEFDDAGEATADVDVWVNVNFRVTVLQAKIIEQEIQRIMQGLKGKAKRSRALEYMAVQSSQAELPGDLA